MCDKKRAERSSDPRRRVSRENPTIRFPSSFSPARFPHGRVPLPHDHDDLIINEYRLSRPGRLTRARVRARNGTVSRPVFRPPRGRIYRGRSMTRRRDPVAVLPFVSETDNRRIPPTPPLPPNPSLAERSLSDVPRDERVTYACSG